MVPTILTVIHAVLLLLFGITLSLSFAGIQFHKKNLLYGLGLYVFCAVLQATTYFTLTEEIVWRLYPLITHLPTVLFLWIGYHKKILTTLASVFTAYLFCEPSKWFGILSYALTENLYLEYIIRYLIIVIVGLISFRYIAPQMSKIFNKDNRSVCIFGIIPAVYYIFDYITVVYTDLWTSYNRSVPEFLAFFLVIIFIIFCSVYYKEYEEKADAERKEQIIRITVEQQAKELHAVKRSEHEIRLLRHDMRLLLTSLEFCIEDGNLEKAKELVSKYSSYVQGTKLEYFCNNETLNYVLSDFAEKCTAKGIHFTHAIEIEVLKIDEIHVASILSNALDNALNALEDVPEGKRCVKLMIKTTDDKLLLSVKNTTGKKPVFVDGLPISGKKGHGYGTQSIRYTTQGLGGNCQFSMQNDVFIVRVIIPQK